MKRIEVYNLKKKCPYCKSDKIKFGSTEEYYGRNYNDKDMYWCENCRACVGCHKGTKIPLGCLADDELKEMRSKIHAIIGQYWGTKKERKDLYARLAKRFRVCGDTFHIGWLKKEDAIYVLYDLEKFGIC